MKLEARVIEEIKTIFDPEIPVDIWELGLIYNIDVEEEGKVKVLMTLTSPACPVAESLPMEVHQKILEIEEVKDVDLQVVFNPPWTKDRMSEEARFALDMF
ncbi:MAG TPA: iron-sulfur cluster assembly protein [Saprospiraceae bacterium]|nr:iron-sulfur cluster assembly protein [Saprospiraceae bacterium]